MNGVKKRIARPACSIDTGVLVFRVYKMFKNGQHDEPADLIVWAL